MLLEDADLASVWAVQRLLDDEGYDIAVCDGPASRGGCALVDDGRCQLAEEADVILNSFALSQPDWRSVVGALTAHLPDTPVIVEVPRPRAALNAALLAGCRVLEFPPTPNTIRREVREALVQRSVSAPPPDDGTSHPG